MIQRFRNFCFRFRQSFNIALRNLSIQIKWNTDRLFLPLTNDHFELYHKIHEICLKEIGKMPSLRSCKDFNDRIQWLKLFDQTEAQIKCSDKILVREYVREKVGGKYLVELYQTCDTFDQINFSRLPNSFVIKTNHDSGTVVLVRNKSEIDLCAAKEKIESALKRKFGWELGEWAYAFVQPRILVEQFISPEKTTSPPDYKFYVVEGRVKFMHYISDRGSNTKEQTVSPDGLDLATSLYPNFQLSNSFQKPSSWGEMIKIAELLGTGFKCVRIDMFEENGKIYVGELTFWPMYGCYKGEGQKKLGVLLDFCRKTYKNPIYKKYKIEN